VKIESVTAVINATTAAAAIVIHAAATGLAHVNARLVRVSSLKAKETKYT
jgi:hypothetical protein